MKKLSFKFLIFLFFIVSCKKEVIEIKEDPYYIYENVGDTSSNSLNNDPTILNYDYVDDSLILGYEWTLIDGRVYVDNIDKGYKNVYDYFDITTNVASTSIFDPSQVIMDGIEKNITKWYFSNDTFLLNNQFVFDFDYYYNPFNDLILRPFGLNGGTSRPITVLEADSSHMKISVRESYSSDNVYNYKYVSELIFQRENVPPTIDVSYKDGYTYNGKWVYTTSDDNSNMEGSKWIIRRYNNGLSGNVYPNDTLDFISNNKYTINGGIHRSYTISNVVGNNMKSLSLYGLTTLGGDYSGQIMSTFMDDGVINNTQFHDIFNVNNSVTIWVERIY